MLIGLVGKPNVGKSTFFSAATTAPAEIANYPFTTIEPNRGVAHVRAPCAHVAVGADACAPRTGHCIDGTRFVPVEVLDVAGIVPDAHTGKGLGNQFLDNLRAADVLIHVVDASGGTDAEGNPVDAGSHDPADDIAFLEDEIDQWVAGIITKGFDRAARANVHKGEKLEHVLAERLSGLGVKEAQVVVALREAAITTDPTSWAAEETLALARAIRRRSKPIILALNKADVADPARLASLAEGAPLAVATSANAELALRKASDAGVVDYLPGSDTFAIVAPDKLTKAQRHGLDYIQQHVLTAHQSTGVQTLIERAVYEHLERIVVYPVEDENKWTDKDGQVLPDAFLLPRGTTAKEMAYKVHTDLGDHFVRAVNAKTHRVVGADYACEDGDVLRIVATK